MSNPARTYGMWRRGKQTRKWWGKLPTMQIRCPYGARTGSGGRPLLGQTPSMLVSLHPAMDVKPQWEARAYIAGVAPGPHAARLHELLLISTGRRGYPPSLPQAASPANLRRKCRHMKYQIKSRRLAIILFENDCSSLKICVEAAIERGANLRDAKGIVPERCTDLLILLDQPGKIHAYKLVNSKNEGPFNGGLKYEIGKSVSVKNADTDPDFQCAAGINVATLLWCLRNYSDGNKILIVEFTAKDIAVIPTATDGKFRLHRCKVTAEKDLSFLEAEKAKMAA